MKNTGGPAFPVECSFQDGQPRGLQTGNTTGWEIGMTLRDYFAGQALPQIGIHYEADEIGEGMPTDFERATDIARRAYQIADAMLAERGKE